MRLVGNRALPDLPESLPQNLFSEGLIADRFETQAQDDRGMPVIERCERAGISTGNSSDQRLIA